MKGWKGYFFHSDLKAKKGFSKSEDSEIDRKIRKYDSETDRWDVYFLIHI